MTWLIPFGVTILAALVMVWMYRTKKPAHYWSMVDGLSFMLSGALAIIVSLAAWLVWAVVT